jgi:alkylated DNA repair dioxygenase AlkB
MNDTPQLAGPQGLNVIEEFIPSIEQDEIIDHLDEALWSTSLKRRVIHWGRRYHYSGRIDSANSAPPIPSFLRGLANEVRYVANMGSGEMAIIVNEYQPGQGIAAHVDHQQWGPVVCTLSLLSEIPMTFRSRDQKIDIKLSPGSLAILSGPSRYEWSHAIAARKSDLINGQRRPRTRRISITFRTVNDGSVRQGTLDPSRDASVSVRDQGGHHA